MTPSSRWLALGLLAVALSARAQDEDFSRVEIEVVPVADGIHMLVGRGGNVGVCSGPDGVFLVDDQYAPLTAKIRAAVQSVHPGPLRFVLNTHWHQDHTGGNENLGKAGALLVAHERVRERMSLGQFVPLLERKVPAAPPGALPVLTFSDAITFHWNGEEIAVSHAPRAHTDGDAVVHFRRADVVHMGDTYFNGFYPFIDVWSGGSIDGMISATDAVLATAGPSTRIIPGHGPLSGRAQLVAFRDMLVQVRARGKEAIARGLDADAWLAERPTADLDPTWGGGFLGPERFLRIVHADLSGAVP